MPFWSLLCPSWKSKFSADFHHRFKLDFCVFKWLLVLLCSPPRKVNSFLNKMNPTEVQMAAYIDTMRDKQWPEFQPAAPPPPRTDEEKNETRERAHSLISARCRRHLSALKEVTRYFWLLIIYKQNITFSL